MNTTPKPTVNPLRPPAAALTTALLIAAATVLQGCATPAPQRPPLGVLQGQAAVAEPAPLTPETPLITVGAPELTQILSFTTPVTENNDGALQARVGFTNTSNYRYTFTWQAVFYDAEGNPIANASPPRTTLADPGQTVTIRAASPTARAQSVRFHLDWASR